MNETLLIPSVNVYLKVHTETGKLYFGKTIKTNLAHYKGSGKRWVRHITKHGKNKVKNLFIETFAVKEDLQEFCDFFSEFYDIAQSEKFLNFIPETGLDGGDTKYANYINTNGDVVKHLKTESALSLIAAGWVLRQSNEGRTRAGVFKQHKNKNTISVLNRLTLDSKRINKNEYDKNIHVKCGSKEFYKLLNKSVPKKSLSVVKVVTLDKEVIVISHEEFLNRDDVFSIVSNEGKALLLDKSAGNRKGMLNCVDAFGVLHNVTKEDYWSQLEKLGEDRSKWSLVHHSHPEGKLRKALRKKI